MNSNRNFVFSDNTDALDGLGCFKGLMKAGISNSEELFQSLASVLNFPEYFGDNWNAMLDCLRDLNWIEERIVLLVHSDIPKIDSVDMKNYIEVLDSAISSWMDEDSHELFIFFPKQARSIIGSIIAKRP